MKKYQFEINDLRALLTVLNVILILKFGLSVAWFGLGISVFGFVKDITEEEKRINSIVMHFSTIILNSYFVVSSYGLKV